MSLEIGELYRVANSSILGIAVTRSSVVTKFPGTAGLSYLATDQFSLVKQDYVTILDLMRNWQISEQEFDKLVDGTLRNLLFPEKASPTTHSEPTDSEALDEPEVPFEKRLYDIYYKNVTPARRRTAAQRSTVITKMLAQGFTTQAISEKLNIKRPTLLTFMRRHGLKLRDDSTKNQILTRHIKRHLPKIITGQISITQLAKQLKTTPHRIRKAIKEKGLRLPSQKYPGRKPRKALLPLLETVLTYYRKGTPLYKSCKMAGIRYETVTALLKRLAKQGYSLKKIAANGWPF